MRERGLVRSLIRHPPTLVAAIFLVLFVAELIILPWEHLGSATYGNILQSLVPPAFVHGGNPAFPLGTDLEGRNLLVRVLAAGRTSLLIGVSVTALSIAIGVLAGVLAGWIPRVDDVLMRVADIQLAFPSIMLAIALAAALHGTSVLNVIIVLTVAGWVTYARLCRGLTLSLKAALYVEAARSVGASDLHIVWRHVLPNLIAPVFALAAVQIGQVIIQEASLSYLGLGVPTSIPSWGSMLHEGQTLIFEAWWPALVPGVVMSVTVMAITVVGDFLTKYVSIERPSLLVTGRPVRQRKHLPRHGVVSKEPRSVDFL